MAGQSRIPNRIVVADSAAAALQDAEIVCVATTSPTPVLVAADVPRGAHINAVGSYRPEMIELDPTLVAQCRVVVDQWEAAMAEAGEVIAAIRDAALPCHFPRKPLRALPRP
jgi:ornithine cyclodeaminase